VLNICKKKMIMRRFIFPLLSLVAIAVACDKKTDDDSGAPKSICAGFFDSHQMDATFSAGGVSGDFSLDFSQGNSYKVVIFKSGAISIYGGNQTYEFLKDMITDCSETHESNIFYENTITGNKVILQHEQGVYQVVLYNASGQVELNRRGPADLTLLKQRAGNYTVTGMSAQAAHNRMSVTINADGTIDFDSTVNYGDQDITAVFDRLDCCNRIHVDLIPGTMNFYWSQAGFTQLDSIQFNFDTWYFN
jgi:hypothetical protein